MRATKLIATLALSAVLFTGCGLKDQNAIIKINDKSITKAEYEKAIDKAIGSSPLAQMGDLKGNKDGFLYLMTEQGVINQLIIQELLDQEAEERGIKATSKDVDQALMKIIDQMGGKDKLMEVLRANNISVNDFKNDLKHQVLMQKLADSVGEIKITDKDCEAYYKKNQDKFKHPDQVRASHILIAANPYQLQEELKANSKKELSEEEIKTKVEAQLAEKQAQAEKLAKELKADKSKFAEYAKQYSDDEGSAKNGGDLGFFAKEQMVPEFANVAFAAKPDSISDVVKTQYGYHIIHVQDRRAAGIAPYAKVKSEIKDYLRTEKQIEALDKLTAAAKKKAKIEFMDERYNPEVIQEKLHKQMDNVTDGQATKVREATNEKKK